MAGHAELAALDYGAFTHYLYEKTPTQKKKLKTSVKRNIFGTLSGTRYVVVVVVVTLTRLIKSVVTGHAPLTLERNNTPGQTYNANQKWYT